VSDAGDTPGRIVLVTGGSRGIGLAVAQRFAAAGDRVAVTYRSSDPPDGLFGVKCDVTSTADVDSAFAAIEEHFGGPVEVLVSNAGVNKDMLLLRMSEADFTGVIDANLTAAFRVVKRATQGMLRARRGRIILMSSVVGLLGSAGQANYAASKAGVTAMTKSLAKELAGKGVTVNAVAPGFIETEMMESIPEKVRQRLLDQIPLRRFGKADEVARAVIYLVSSDGDYITGEELSMNGGLLMR
jgi:3-oxoacyl-[acyl-carrier protein] reductase